MKPIEFSMKLRKELIERTGLVDIKTVVKENERGLVYSIRTQFTDRVDYARRKNLIVVFLRNIGVKGLIRDFEMYGGGMTIKFFNPPPQYNVVYCKLKRREG